MEYKELILQRCSIMDKIPVDAREKMLSFGNALTAIEGINAGAEAKQSIKSWMTGQTSYHEGYIRVLTKYNLLEA